MTTMEEAYTPYDQNVYRRRRKAMLQANPAKWAEYRAKQSARRKAERERIRAQDPEAYAAKLRNRSRSERLKWDDISCRFEKEDGAAVRAQAAKLGVPVAELIRTYVTWGLEQEKENT